jgi:hypothetical protein
MATSTPSSVPTTFVAAQESKMSFEVVGGVERIGRDDKNGNTRYLIKVKFLSSSKDPKDIREETFQAESKSLQTAFEMIEVVAQQTRGLDREGFVKFQNSNRGKRMWFDMTNISNQPGSKTDLVTVYKKDHHGNSLEYVFAGTPKIKIENKILDELQDIAKRHQTHIDPSVDLNQHNIQVLLKRKAQNS